MKIPFNKPFMTGKELHYISQAHATGHLSGDGQFTKKCHLWLEDRLGCRKALLTHSCTAALEMCAILLDIGPGDEVIIPSFTFVSTANAFALRGARPVFVDVRKDTLNVDPEKIESAISDKTKAIVVVHYAGAGCDMDEILDIGARHGLPVVEDNAHGLLGKYGGRYLGTFGVLATVSFHETKNFTCGEGGALLVNDPRYVDRAEIIREKGTNRGAFFRGEVDKYTWVDVGSSFLPSETLAAFLYAQLEAEEQIQSKRRRIWEYYARNLADWADTQAVRLPTVPSRCEQAYHMFYMLTPTPAARTRLIAHLKDRGILSVFHYVPLHLSPMGRRFGGKPGDCPVTEDISERLVRLPFYNDLTEDEQGIVVASIQELEL